MTIWTGFRRRVAYFKWLSGNLVLGFNDQRHSGFGAVHARIEVLRAAVGGEAQFSEVGKPRCGSQDLIILAIGTRKREPVFMSRVKRRPMAHNQVHVQETSRAACEGSWTR